MTEVMTLTFDLGSNDPNPNLSLSMPFFPQSEHTSASGCSHPSSSQAAGMHKAGPAQWGDSPPLLPKKILTAPKAGTVSQAGKPLGENNGITEWFGLKRTF